MTGIEEDTRADSDDRMNKLSALRKLEPIVPVAGIAEAEDKGGDDQRAGIYERLSWSYRYETVSQISAKTSVTEMKKPLALQDSPSWICFRSRLYNVRATKISGRRFLHTELAAAEIYGVNEADTRGTGNRVSYDHAACASSTTGGSYGTDAGDRRHDPLSCRKEIITGEQAPR